MIFCANLAQRFVKQYLTLFTIANSVSKTLRDNYSLTALFRDTKSSASAELFAFVGRCLGAAALFTTHAACDIMKMKSSCKGEDLVEKETLLVASVARCCADLGNLTLWRGL